MNKYIIILAKDEQGVETKYRFIVSMKKSIKSMPELFGAIMSIEGIDGIAPHARYTFEVMIARAFDAEEVYTQCIKVLEKELSDIFVPKLVT